jgi:hypothetical protein
MLAFWEEAGQGGGAMEERFLSVVAVTLTGEQNAGARSVTVAINFHAQAHAPVQIVALLRRSDVLPVAHA